MIEFVEYRDDKIRIKIPKQLRKKNNIRLFCGNLVRGKPESQVMVGIDLKFDARRFRESTKILRNIGVRNLPPGQKVLRSGKCSFGKDGIELFTSANVRDKGYTLYSWQVLYRLQGSYVDLTVMGGGSREEFESMAKEIITSLKLLSPLQSKKAAIGSTIKSIKQGDLKAKDRARLASALESLPEELKYLRESILAIADEDQDLLGSGGIDTDLLAKAIENQAKLQPSGFAANQSKKLEKWLKRNTSKKDLWAGPAWFVMAFLMGYDVYKGEDAESSVQSLTKVVNRLLDADPKL